MTETAADRLTPAQAADLLRVLDLHARWENLRGEPRAGGPVSSGPDLRALQSAFEAYRSALAAYTARYKVDQVPEVAGSAAGRVAAWCRAVRAVVRRAEGQAGVACPADVLVKVYRLADRIARRSHQECVGRGSMADGLWAAIQQLDAVIRWCEGLADAPPSEGPVPLTSAP